MDTPVTPKRTRPALGGRSLTDGPPKSGSSSASSHPKRYHLDLFNHSPYRHHVFHHSQAKDKRNGDKLGSKTNLRQQLQQPVAELANIASGQKSTRGIGKEPFGQASLLNLPRRPIGPADVENERQKGRLRDDAVRSSLNKLLDTANNSTRRLDLSFYSLLEKVRALRSTISRLHELSTASNELRENFQRDSAHVEQDTQRQIDTFNGFGVQQDRVQDLESRVSAGMAKAEELSARLEAARKEVEKWEARENEWQTKMSKRLTICWSCLGTFLALVVLLVAVKRFVFSRSTKETVPELPKNASLPSFIVEDLAEISSRITAAKSTSSPPTPVTLAGDKRLKGFEEL